MARTLDVYVDGDLAGRASMSSGGALSFDYEDEYLDRLQPTPLSLSLPIERRTHKNRVVLPFLQGLLPDNAQALGSMATTFGVSAASPFALLEHVGRDVAGALQFMPHGVPSTDHELARKAVRKLTESEIEGMLGAVIDEYLDGTPLTREHDRFSLAGAQPKIALFGFEDGGWGLPNDSTPTTHILKPASGRFRRLDVVEQVTMAAARGLGLSVADSTLAEFGRYKTFVTTRYDRFREGGVWHRRHQEDMCQALGISPTKKYQRVDGGPGSAAIAQLISTFPLIDDRQRSARSFFEGFVFNAVVGATDAHAKNYSILLDGDSVRLAPLYDLATYAPFRRSDEVIQLPMHVNGEYRLDAISNSDLAAAGTPFRLAAGEAADIVARIRSGTREAFEAAAASMEGVSAEAAEYAREIAGAVANLPLVD